MEGIPWLRVPNGECYNMDSVVDPLICPRYEGIPYLLNFIYAGCCLKNIIAETPSLDERRKRITNIEQKKPRTIHAAKPCNLCT